MSGSVSALEYATARDVSSTNLFSRWRDQVDELDHVNVENASNIQTRDSESVIVDQGWMFERAELLNARDSGGARRPKFAFF